MAKEYIDTLRAAGAGLQLRDDLSLSSLLRLPDLFQTGGGEEEEKLYAAAALQALEEALAAFQQMRRAEGEKLQADILGRLATVETLAKEVERSAPARLEAYTARLYEKLRLVLEDRQVEDARVLQEAALFADRTATDEETVRLASHAAQFRKLLAEGGSIGKKCDFLVQEMNREANTIGSKAGDLATTEAVLALKNEIEKIREQIQNIE